MNKLIMIIAGIWIASFIAGVIAGGDIITPSIDKKDIKQTPVTIDIEAGTTSSIDEVFAGVIISSVDSNGNFGIYKEGVINRPLKLDVNGKTKVEIESEQATLAKQALEEIRPLFETTPSIPVTYLTDEQVVSINKVTAPVEEITP